LLPPLLPDPERGLTAVGWTGERTLTAPVGVLDRPFHHRRDLLVADLSGSGGHVGIVGGPQSGKSTMIRTLVTSLALTHTPREVQFYCLDFGGGTLAGLAALPHVGSVTGRLDVERLHRTVAEIDGIISRRELAFSARGIDSMNMLRQLRAAGVADDDPYGDVFLVVDGWGTIRQDFPDLAPTLGLIATRGLSYGVHVVVAASRWGELNSQLRDQLGTRFELRMGDPVESHVNIRAAATVPKAPGRGLTEDELHFLSALPRIDGVSGTADLAEAVATMTDTVAGLWSGPRAPGVRMLPTSIAAASLPPPEADLKVALGIEEHQLAPFWHDFEQSPHLLVVGDMESGKTNLLRLVAQAVTRRFSPAEAKIMLVDYRRELLDSVPEAYRLGYAVSLDVVRQVVDGAARAMHERLPPADLPPERLSARDWYTGPRLYLLVDDYDLVAGSTMANPFGPLLDYLAQSTEIGLHLVVARSATGVSRGLSEPLLRRLQEVNTPVALLSCPPSEGRLFNDVKPRTLPPGRALYLTRRGTLQVQTALTDFRRPPPTVLA
jgi:S-DNA-T family DNA segregation ATPase FtsK/SpoIIIE